MPELDQRVPELVGGVDIRTLPLSALDGFVLSRIDGRTRVGEIVAMTGLPGEQVLEILERMVGLGAVRMPGAVAPKPAPSEPPPRASVPPPSGRPRTLSQPPTASSSPPRRRPSMMMGATPRRVFAESSISGPPPDVRSIPPRARVSTPARPRTPVPPPETLASVEAPRTHKRESIPVTLPPLSLPPSMSGPPLFGTPPTSTTKLITERNPFDSDANTGTRPQPPISSLGPLPERSERPQLYDPKELDEQVDLPRERRKQVLDLYYRLPDIDFYALLGVPESAEKKEIRSAYFSLSKAFHPDSMFRKELGSFKAKMTTVFQALTEAYETLSKKKGRDEYDAYLRTTRSVQDAERALATDEVAHADANIEVPRPPPLPSTDYELPPPTPPPAPARASTPEAQRIARELVAKRLKGLPPRPQPPEPKVAEAPPRPSAPVGRLELVKQLGRTLMDVSKVTGSADKLTRALTSSKAAFERGDVAGSVQHMARAFSLAPDRADLHQEYERLSRMLAQQMAHNYEEQAKFEMKQSKFAAAALSWQRVCEGKPDDAVAHRNTALCMLKAGGDQRGAQKYAQQAVYLAPNDIDARVLLAQAYLTVGLKLNAKRELDAAAKLDPAHEVVKNLLSDLSK